MQSHNNVNHQFLDLPIEILLYIFKFFPNHLPLISLLLTSKKFSFLKSSFNGYVEKFMPNNFSPDDKKIVISDGYESIKVFDVTIDKLIHELIYPDIQDALKNSWITSAEFSSNGSQIMAHGSYHVYLWDATTGKLTASLFHVEHIESSSYSKDGKYIVSTSEDGFNGVFKGQVDFWNAKSGKLIHSFKHNAVFDALISPDNKFVISVSDKGSVKIWETKSGEELHTINKFLCLRAKYICFSPDSKSVAIVNHEDKSIDVHDIITGELIYQFKSKRFWIYGVYFSPNGDFIACGNNENEIEVFNIKTKAYYSLEIGAQYSRVVSIDFSKDANLILAVSGDNTVKIWQLDTFTEVLQLKNAHAASFSRHDKLVYFDKKNERVNIIKFPVSQFSIAPQISKSSDASLIDKFGNWNKVESVQKIEKEDSKNIEEGSNHKCCVVQ